MFNLLLFPPSLLPAHSLHNFHTGGTRGFLIACLRKHDLFPPSSAGASSCGLVPYWQSGRQTDRVTIVYVSRKKKTQRKRRGEKKLRISDIFAEPSKATAPLTDRIKGRWRFSALLQAFFVVLLSEVFSFIFSCNILRISVLLTTIVGSKWCDMLSRP